MALPLVLENLIKKRDKAPGSENIRPLLLILGGGMRGVYGAGQVCAFHKLGLDKVFHQVVGVSTGAAIGAYFLAGERQARLGTSLYYEECTTKSFIDIFRFRKIMDINYIIQQMSDGPKALDCDAIKRSPTEFYVEAELRSGECALIDVKTAFPGVLRALQASMSIPLFYGKGVIVNGEEMTDGSFCKNPMWEAIDKFKPTDVLILPNISKKNEKQILETKRDICKFCPNVEILWPSDISIGKITTDKRKLRSAVEDSARKTFEAFEQESEEIEFLSFEGKSAKILA